MFHILSIILKNKKYLIIALVTTALMASVSYYLTVVNVYRNSPFVYADMNGTWFTIFSLILGAAISILLGGYIALLVFRRDIVKAKSAGNKIAGLSGTVVSLIATGCPTCGAPLLALVGWPLGLMALPFYGLELKVLSIVFLLLAMFFISKNIKHNLTNSCSIKK